MRSLAIEHNLEEQVHFPGEVKEPIKALAVMDLYISINVGSITGLAGMEAAMFGVPVIAMQWKRGYIATPNDWIWSSTNQSDVAQCSCDLLASKKVVMLWRINRNLTCNCIIQLMLWLIPTMTFTRLCY